MDNEPAPLGAHRVELGLHLVRPKWHQVQRCHAAHKHVGIDKRRVQYDVERRARRCKRVEKVKRIALAMGTAAIGLALFMTSGGASAQEPATGTPGEPQCHGERVSFGSSVFRITPKDRAEFNGITVQEFQIRVRQSCEG